MIDTNTDTLEHTVAKGRQFLEQGDVSSAVEHYGKAFDPDAVDESEARGMLIEAHALLARKHLTEALDAFEEALVMGTDVQRRQALDGIAAIGKIRSRLGGLTAALRKGLKEHLGRRTSLSLGIATLGEEENVVLLSRETVAGLPEHLAKKKKIGKVPQHLVDIELPMNADSCVPYTEKEDIEYILELAAWLAGSKAPEQSQ